MEVILLEKIANLGELGQVVKVKDGYARNFLIPHGKARRATEENRKAFEAKRADLEKAQAATLAKAKERGEKLASLKLQITQKAGPDGRLFGSVTNYDIVEALQKQGHEVERANIRMPQGPLKQVGEFPIEIALHTDVAVTVTVAVVGEQEALSSSDAKRARKGPLFFVNGAENRYPQVNHRPSTASRPTSVEFQTLSAGPVEKSIVAEIYFSVAERVCLRCAPGGKQNKWPRYSRLPVLKFPISKS
jgi:large subunit ribosomal protein L9